MFTHVSSCLALVCLTACGSQLFASASTHSVVSFPSLLKHVCGFLRSFSKFAFLLVSEVRFSWPIASHHDLLGFTLTWRHSSFNLVSIHDWIFSSSDGSWSDLEGRHCEISSSRCCLRYSLMVNGLRISGSLTSSEFSLTLIYEN